MAADLRDELGIGVETVPGRYGEFTILVDGQPVVSGGQLAFLGVLPTKRAVRDAVIEHLATPPSAVADTTKPSA